jgi:hypothetical protein
LSIPKHKNKEIMKNLSKQSKVSINNQLRAQLGWKIDRSEEANERALKRNHSELDSIARLLRAQINENNK